MRQNQRKLLGTAGAWFILDVVFYANGLFSGQVTAAMNFGSSPRSEATASMILQALSIPGYVCTILYVDRIGLRRLQFWGFLATTAFFFLMAVLQPYLIKVSRIHWRVDMDNSCTLLLFLASARHAAAGNSGSMYTIVLNLIHS